MNKSNRKEKKRKREDRPDVTESKWSNVMPG